MTGEFELIGRLARYLDVDAPGVHVGHGDDAAVLAVGAHGVALAVDALVEGRHFRFDVSSPADVGWKAVAVNVSDLAAMGAEPLGAVVALLRPDGVAPEDVEALYAGMREASDRWGLRLVGGDTVSSDELAISVTVLGLVSPGHAVRRSGAQPGDRLVLVGPLGAAGTGLALLRRTGRADDRLLGVHRRPRAYPRAGAVLAAYGASAMIDVSDGLGADLGHVCAASGTGARVEAATLPIAAGVADAATDMGLDLWDTVCGGGEDFALLAAVPREHAQRAAEAAAETEDVVTAIVGEVVAYGGEGARAVLVLPDGTDRDLTGLGYDHYRRQQP